MRCWHIIRVTTSGREAYVAKEIERLGLGQAWVPEIYTSARICRQSKQRKLIARPVMSRTLFAAVPEYHQRLLAPIRYYDGLHRDLAGGALAMPHWQITRFMDCLANVNEAEMRRLEAYAKQPRKRGQTFRLDPASVPAMLNELFGVEIAA